MQRKRKLYLSICNYKNEVVCDLYDNQADVTGQATNVFIDTERNGWKELTFDIPSTCMGAEGEEENYRLKYLIAEYRIKAITDTETDWFIISEPKITRNHFSKNVSVRAGHISQLLKHKNLDLEFSDDEGNNVGTAEAILDTILAGTDWTTGRVGEQDEYGNWHTFLEDDGSAKKRSLTAQAGTGALGLIEKLCDVFEAKPVYHGDTKTIDLLSMNPFAKVDPENIPATLRDKDLKVLELYYNRNVHGLDKTNNVDNMATRLYAYGSYGDMNGLCTLQNAVHNDWRFTITRIASEYHFALGDVNFFFQGDVALNNVLVWSDMDLTSMSYIFNETKNKAYRVYKLPKTQNYIDLPLSNPEEVTNGFAYLLGLQYYNEVGLMTDEQFQAIAHFQREMPALYKIIEERSNEYIKGEATLSKIAEHSNGLLKLNIQRRSNNQYYINTAQNDHGVIYRTDYDVAERRYFQWHITDKLNEFGDPVTGTPSLLFIVHNTNPVTYDMTYLKCIWDNTGMVVDDDNNPADFEYSDGKYPVSFTVWDNNIRFTQATDRVYLFCTNAMQGRLGSRLASIESVYQELDSATMKHPVTFRDADANATIPTPSNAEYEWRYDYHNTTNGELYFCWKAKYNETTWRRVYISDELPSSSITSGYYYNTRRKTLHRWNGTTWAKIEDKQITVKMFETVIYYCHRRDELFRGIYEYYYHNQSKTVGNYAIFDGYNAYWSFKLKESANNLLLDYVNGNVYSNVTFNGNTPIIGNNLVATQQSVESRSVVFPTDNELATVSFYPGTIKNGVDAKTDNTNYRTAFIPVTSNTTYYYRLPADSVIYRYNASKTYASKVTVTTQTGSFTTGTNKYIKLLVPTIETQSYIKEGSVNADNILRDRPFANGSISSNGQDLEVDAYRTYTIQAYEGTAYQYSLPASSRVFYYDINLNYISFTSLTSSQAASGQFTTPANTRFMRFVSSTNNMSNYYVRVKNYNKVFYLNREQYLILDNITGKGELIGITPLIKKFADVADKAYEVDLATLQQTQESVKTAEDNLAALLGDMLKDGRWQDSNYIFGDEKRLYDDAMYMLRQISYPETTYSFTYLDMFGVKNEHFYEEHETSWPDIEITQTAHLVDPESNTNCWAYIDKINKCYDQPWETTVEIDTKLTLAARHGFTDVIARIAEVAKEMKAKQGLYDLAALGKISGSRLEGAIQLNQVYLNGGASNWHNDGKGNLIFEAEDGLSAMKLSGRGLGVSTQKLDDGSWLWRTAATGYGLTADAITTGYINAERIDAGTITLDKLSSNVGKELEIGSNAALMLYATEDGSRPAGSLRTTDGYIEVRAGQDSNPAKINIVSGGELNLNGGNVNIYSEGTMDVSSGGRFVLKSQEADSIDSTGNGLFIDSEEGVNFAGGKFKVQAHGNAMDVRIKADVLELGQTGAAVLSMDAAAKTIDIGALNAININGGNTVTITAGNTLSLITQGTIKIGKTGHLFTIGGDDNRSYIYHGLSSTTGTSNGVYIGTDGFALKQSNTKFVAASGTIELSTGSSSGDYVSMSVSDDYRIWAGHPTASSAPFSVKKDGQLYSISGKIATWNIAEKQLSSGSGSGYVALNSNTALITGTQTYQQPYAIWAGAETSSSAPFKVKRDGTLYATGAQISGNVVITSGSINIQKIVSGIATQTFSVNQDGEMFANKGSIAGWSFDDKTLKGNKVGLAKTDNNTDIAIWAGQTNPVTQSSYAGPNGTTLTENVYAPFRVTQGGAMYATTGGIGGFTLTATTLTGEKIGLAKTNDDGHIAIWAGNNDKTKANFRVTQGGELTAVGAKLNTATIEGGTFKVIKDNTIIMEINHISNGVPDGKIYMRAGGTGGGWMMDPNDFAGPWQGTYGSVNQNSSGYVQINCNPNASENPRICVGPDGGKFRVYSNGNIYFNGTGPAVIITSLSSSGISGVTANGASVSASFFSSSLLGVGRDGTNIYPTYNNTPYTGKGKTIGLSIGDWTSVGSKRVSVTFDGTEVTYTFVVIPEVSETQWYNNGNSYIAGIKLGNTWRYSEWKDFSDVGYAAGRKAGWNACVAAVESTKSGFYRYTPASRTVTINDVGRNVSDLCSRYWFNYYNNVSPE